MSKKIPTGRFVWFEHMSSDPKKAEAFYGELFNWKTSSMPTPDGSTYTMIKLGEQMIGGFMKTPDGAPAHAHWISHLQVEDANASAEKVKSLGGTVLKGPTKMGDMGTWVMSKDPTGGAFAMWQPGKTEGDGDFGTAPGTWIWNELMTDDDEKACAFYRGLAGFGELKKEMGPGVTYHVMTFDGKNRAGIMKQPMPGAPTAWLPYVHAAKVDETAERAKKLGGNVLVSPQDIPEVGRFAVITDTLGGAVGLLQPLPMS